jgi:hypothetical protein
MTEANADQFRTATGISKKSHEVGLDVSQRVCQRNRSEAAVPDWVFDPAAVASLAIARRSAKPSMRQVCTIAERKTSLFWA